MDEYRILTTISAIRESAYVFVEHELQANGFYGVLPSHGNILAILYREQKPIPITEIVEYTKKAKSTVTANLHTLEKNGYITRMSNPDDNRSYLVSLTAKGERLMPVFYEISRMVHERLFSNLDSDEKQMFLTVLEKIEGNAKG